VDVKAVYRDNLSPAQTILSVRKLNGQVILAGVLTDQARSATLHLPPGEYSLTAVGGETDVPIQVVPPGTSITIQVTRPQGSGDAGKEVEQATGKPLAPDDAKKDSQEVEVHEGKSADAFGGRILISVIGISYEGDPLRHKVSSRVGLAGNRPTTYEKKDVGEAVSQGGSNVRITEAQISSARFSISELAGANRKKSQ